MRRVGIVLGTAVMCSVLVALGVWQLQRRAWKLDLIARVEQRVHAPAESAPAFDAAVQVARDEYRHVQVQGRFLYAASTQVQALTELGPGYWLLTPLQRPDGSLVLVNRGYVPAHWVETDRDTSERTLTGLLRMSEPGGAFLRANDAAQNRWTSRDVQAIAKARGLARVAPYFIDLDAGTQTRSAAPVAGLTVLHFANNHLGYALTWFALALMAAGGAWIVLRSPPGHDGTE